MDAWDSWFDHHSTSHVPGPVMLTHSSAILRPGRAYHPKMPSLYSRLGVLGIATASNASIYNSLVFGAMFTELIANLLLPSLIRTLQTPPLVGRDGS